MKHLLWLAPLLALLIWGQMRGPDGFREECMLRGISYPNPPQQMGRDEVMRRLSQRFTLLGSGTQAGALLGEDGETVFKFILRRSLVGEKRFSWPSRHRPKRIAMRCVEGEKTLKRYSEAFAACRDDLAILYTRFDPAEGPLPPLRVVCADGIERDVSLEGVPFWLQRKMEPVMPTPHAKAALLALLKRRVASGFFDLRRGAINRSNYGFIGERAHIIDAGRIERLAEIDPAEELARLEQELNRWFIPLLVEK